MRFLHDPTKLIDGFQKRDGGILLRRIFSGIIPLTKVARLPVAPRLFSIAQEKVRIPKINVDQRRSIHFPNVVIANRSGVLVEIIEQIIMGRAKNFLTFRTARASADRLSDTLVNHSRRPTVGPTHAPPHRDRDVVKVSG